MLDLEDLMMAPCRASFVAVLLAVPALAAAESATAVHDAGELEIEATILASGDFMAFGFDSLWLAGGTQMFHVDPATNTVTEIELPGAYGAFRAPAIGADAIWVASAAAGMIYRVDPEQNQATLQIPAKMRDSEGSLAADFGSVWAVVSADEPEGSSGRREPERALARFDAASGELLAQIALPGVSAGVAVANGAVWVTSPYEGEVYRVDPVTDAVTATVETGGQPRFLVADAGVLWILDLAGVVHRIDTGSATVVASIPLGHPFGGGDITVGAGSVWVTLPGTPVIRIDPGANEVRAAYEGGATGDAIRFGAGSLWVSGDSLSRIAPPR